MAGLSTRSQPAALFTLPGRRTQRSRVAELVGAGLIPLHKIRMPPKGTGRLKTENCAINAGSNSTTPRLVK